jgi:arylsulfatase A-like enzyme
VTTSYKQNPPNILEILVDDLGYGDTSVSPFVGLNVNTPNLEIMASKGMKLTNYHTAAATCTPTRSSILTGMYPWRLGIKAVFEYGERGSNRDDWLVTVPTLPMVLREANYSVTHSGKWHLGGMRNDDLDMRLLPVKPVDEPGGRRCPHPGPNQQGFKNYISVLDGPGSPRQNRLQLRSELYSQGCTALLENDIDIGRGAYNITGYLTYCEAEHAIHAMNRSVARNKPFYVQLWFHAPHAPLEGIPGYPEYHKKDVRSGPNRKDGSTPYTTKNVTFAEMGITYKYRSMIADMDHQLGRVLRALEALGVERNTLVTFSSDNGPENSAGTTAGYRGKKRAIYEGGIRVPAIVQWVGTIPAGQSSDAFVVSTDLFPTFLDAAGVLAPPHLRLDGLSILPLLVPDYYKARSVHLSPAHAKSSSPKHTALAVTAVTEGKNPGRHAVDEVRLDEQVYRAAMRDRVTLWHNDYEGHRRTAAWVYGYKVILDERERMSEMYDLQTDPYEVNNLLLKAGPEHWKVVNSTVYSKSPSLAHLFKKRVSLDMVLTNRDDSDVHIWIASHLYKTLQDYVKGGNSAHQLLMDANPGWRYQPTVLSDYRSDYITGPSLHAQATGAGAEAARKKLLEGTCGLSPCTCDIRTARQVPTLPFERVPQYEHVSPGRLLNGAALLGLSRA